MILLHLMEIKIFNNDKVAVFLQLLNNSVHPRHILVDLPVNQRNQKRLPDLLNTFDDLVVVVNIDQSGHQLLILNFRHCLVQIRDVIHIEGDKVLFPLRYLKDRLLLAESCHRNLTQIHAVVPAHVGNLKPLSFLFLFRKHTSIQLWDVFAQVRVRSESRPDRLRKLAVTPKYLSIVHQNRVWYGQFPQQDILHTAVLRRKLHQLRKNQGAVVHIQNECDNRIDDDKYAHQEPCALIHHVDPDIHGNQKNRHNHRPLHIQLQLAFKMNRSFFVHLYVLKSIKLQGLLYHFSGVFESSLSVLSCKPLSGGFRKQHFNKLCRLFLVLCITHYADVSRLIDHSDFLCHVIASLQDQGVSLYFTTRKSLL
jgi:hypothetical protein